jgi:hypothetical protein
MAFFLGDLMLVVMQEFEVYLAEKGELICAHCAFSSSLWFRMRGLLGRMELGLDEGIWLKPCNSIHMFFMHFPIDAMFQDREWRVVRIEDSIQPWRCSPIVWNAHSVLEMAAGTRRRMGINPGDRLEFVSEQRRSDLRERHSIHNY